MCAFGSLKFLVSENLGFSKVLRTLGSLIIRIAIT
jgi:hypothetical protein